MAEGTKIEWCDHSWSPWWGCTKVSPGCTNCYADTFSRRVGHGKRLPTVWGPRAERRFFGDAHWTEPLKWDRKAAKAGVRARVFCASMCDVFEEHERPEINDRMRVERHRLWRLIYDTPHLDWLLLTKRPENVARFAPYDVLVRNVWLGTTCEDQRRADERLPHLLAVPAAVRFVSYEPALGPVDFAPWLARTERVYVGDNTSGFLDDKPLLSWIIVGGESGPGARPFDIAWARDVVRQTREAGVACFVKQLGARPVVADLTHVRAPAKPLADGSGYALSLRDAKGGDWSEWPADLRIREWPAGGAR